MSGDSVAAGLAAQMGQGDDLEAAVRRLAGCCGRVEHVLARFREIQLLDWQSPAGRAYRNSIALQEVALARARVQLEDALAVVSRYAQDVISAPAGPAGEFTWPR
jgi:MarR-like DNA-binding transcriptional regulator SgrR of sgrS sRNA